MTNGEKMQAAFPDIEMWGESKDTLDYSLGGMIHRVTKSWWNSEYKEPTTKNDLVVECIDRAELLKAMDTWDKFGYSSRYGLERLDKNDKGFVPYVKYDDMVKCIKGMPSVTPQLLSELDKNSQKLEKDFGESDCISRQSVQTRLKEIINEMETIFADIREREVNDSVCGLCEYDCDHGLDGFANECPGFEKDDCFKMNEKYKAEWLDISNLPSVTPQEPRIDFEELKCKILMEVDGSTDDAWLAYGEVCNRISNSIDEFVADMKGKEE